MTGDLGATDVNGKSSTSLQVWIGSNDPGQQSLADQTLAGMGAEVTLTYFLDHLRIQRRSQFTRAWIGGLAGFAGTCVLAVICALFPWRSVFLGNLGEFFIVLTSLYVSRPTRFHRGCVLRLGQIRDRRTLPALLDVLRDSHDAGREAAARSLLRHLPALERGDVEALTGMQQAHLCRLVRPDRNMPLSIDLRRDIARATLSTLTRLNWAPVRPFARSIARRAPKSDADRPLHQTAVNCLALLDVAVVGDHRSAVRR